MKIHLDKLYFSPHKIIKLHLKDEQCKPTTNKTHYNIITTSLKACLTSVNFNSSHVIYSNILHYVVINFKNMMAAGFGFGGKMVEGKMTLQCSQKRNLVTSSSIKKLTMGMNHSEDMKVSSDVVAASYLPRSKYIIF